MASLHFPPSSTHPISTRQDLPCRLHPRCVHALLLLLLVSRCSTLLRRDSERWLTFDPCSLPLPLRATTTTPTFVHTARLTHPQTVLKRRKDVAATREAKLAATKERKAVSVHPSRPSSTAQASERARVDNGEPRCNEEESSIPKFPRRPARALTT